MNHLSLGRRRNESGVALLMAVFVIALATLLVFEVGQMARFDARASRAFGEGVQGDFLLRSGVNFAQVVLELPKPPGVNEDWLGEPWNLLSAAPSIPISGAIGEARIQIVDESSKIDLNWILGTTKADTTPQTDPQNRRFAKSLLWKTRLAELLTRLGFQTEHFDSRSFRTPGDTAYEAAKQVAVIDDFIDADSVSFSSPSFTGGEGIESDVDKTLFYNRKLANLSEALLIPGITRERLSQMSPYVRVSTAGRSNDQKINVNTAPLEVLLALGFPESRALDIVQQRTKFSITDQILKSFPELDEQLKDATTVTSREFSVYVRVTMPNSTRWLRASIGSTGTPRTTEVTAMEIF